MRGRTDFNRERFSPERNIISVREKMQRDNPYIPIKKPVRDLKKRYAIPERKTVELPGKTIEKTTLKPVPQEVVEVTEKEIRKPRVRESRNERGKTGVLPQPKENVKRVNRIGEGEINPAFKVLRPLETTMRTALREKGEPVPKRIDVLAQQFYNKVVRKNQPNNFTGQNVLPEIYFYDYEKDYVDSAQQSVIDSILNYFTSVQNKPAEQLTPTEQTVLAGMSAKTGKGNAILFVGLGAIVLVLIVVFLIRK